MCRRVEESDRELRRLRKSVWGRVEKSGIRFLARSGIWLEFEEEIEMVFIDEEICKVCGGMKGNEEE